MTQATRACSVPGCNRPLHAKGYCRPCYKQWRKTGSTDRKPRQRNCSVPGCDNPGRLRRGMCQRHYRNWLAHGDPLHARTWPWEPRFWPKVDKNGPTPGHRPELGPCWAWTAHCSPGGYGYFKNAGKNWRAHRFIYVQLVGPIPGDLELDHLCRNRRCVNPSHLEPVPGPENRHRARDVRTHCDNGHEYTPENTRIDRKGVRLCRACQKIYKARYLAKLNSGKRA